MNATHEDVYKASDLCEIVYLFCKGAELVGTETEGRRVIFHFKGYHACRAMVSDIGFGRDFVSLSSALDQVRRARNIMHSV